MSQLDLGWNGVRDEACAAISAALRDGSAPLRELKLHNNHVSAEGGAVLCAALEVRDALELASQLPDISPTSPLHLPTSPIDLPTSPHISPASGARPRARHLP